MMQKPSFVLVLAVAVIAAIGLSQSADARLKEGASGDDTYVRVRRQQSWPMLEQWLRGAEIELAPTRTPALRRSDLAPRGQHLFGLYCVNCHGESGRGDGPRSAVFDPLPRDLTSGVFKFRSTSSGAPPRIQDVFNTITRGLRGTGMLPFADLLEADRWALAAYVLSLSTSLDPPESQVLEPKPTPTDVDSPARIQGGKDAYARLRCDACHGTDGRGNGPSAATLTDSNGRPVETPDFVTRPLKRGNDPAALYLSIVTGLDGSPMPSYQFADKPDAFWDVVAYVRSLRKGTPGVNGRDQQEAVLFVRSQHQQAVHTVVGGCGCRARRR